MTLCKKETILFSIIIKLVSLLMCFKVDLNIAQQNYKKKKIIHTVYFATSSYSSIKHPS